MLSVTNNRKSRFQLLCESMKVNYFTVVCFIIQTVAFSILYPSVENGGWLSNIIMGFITLMFSMISGYFVHVVSHQFEPVSIHDRLKTAVSYIFSEKIGNVIEYLFSGIFNFFLFHDVVHHDSSKNKQFVNVIIEVFQNLLTQGFGLVAFYKLFAFSISIFGYKVEFNYAILAAWGLLYATIHHINYNIIIPYAHIQHHKNKFCNYGIEFMDIIFGSKHETTPEYINHASINILIIMLFIIYVKSFLLKFKLSKSNNNYLIKFLKMCF